MTLKLKTFSELITFTRASSGWYFGSDGLLKQADTDFPRFDFDPVTGLARGLLVEPQRTNTALHSQEFDGASWAVSDAAITANQATSPSGLDDGDSLTGTAGTVGKVVFQNGLTTYATGENSVSVYAKKGTHRWLQMFFSTDTNGVGNFDLDTGLCYVVSGTSCLMESMGSSGGGGWYRCTLTANVTGADGFYIGLVDGAAATRLGVTASVGTVYLWGAQAEEGGFSTSYMPTTSATVTRSADFPKMPNGAERNASQYTVVFDGLRGSETVSGSYNFSLNDDGISERIVAFISGTTPTINVRVGSVSIGNIVSSAVVNAGDQIKVAMSVIDGRIAASVNGAAVVSLVSDVPATTIRQIGYDQASSFFNGRVKSYTEYPTALSDARLVELSTL
jgi:hypothetical protein